MWNLTLAVALALLAPSFAEAGDGRVEINQASALAGGVTPGDGADFPVEIHLSGSYVLTSDLVVPDLTTTAVVVAVPDVVLDLNGFAIRGPGVCVPGNCSQVGSGVGVISASPRTTVIGGAITGTGNTCLYLYDGAHVERVSVSGCGVDGIRVADHGLVLSNRVDSVEDTGIIMGSDTAFANNVVTRTALGGGSQGTVVGGRPTGGNICDDGRCTYDGRRAFYLTPSLTQGDGVLSACDTGFHTASLWEIYDPSALHYDLVRGRSEDDSGSGPPATYGWARTGAYADSVVSGALSNCDVWTSNSAPDLGTVIQLDPTAVASSGALQIGPWAVSEDAGCQISRPVWCVSD